MNGAARAVPRALIRVGIAQSQASIGAGAERHEISADSVRPVVVGRMSDVAQIDLFCASSPLCLTLSTSLHEAVQRACTLALYHSA